MKWIEVESNQKFYKHRFWPGYILTVPENNLYSTGTDGTFSGVAAWNADQKNAGSNLFCILFFLYFKSEGCRFESREQ